MYVSKAVKALIRDVVNCTSARRRGGRVAECGGLLNLPVLSLLIAVRVFC